MADAGVWRSRDSEVVARVYSRYSDLVVDRAEGSHLYTVDGRDVLDFGCGIGVTNLGHNHPAVVAAVREQLEQLWHVSVTTFHPKMVEAAEALVSVTPEGLDSVFLNNSGAEAIEASVKLARRATERTEILAFTGAFHGRTYGAVTLTSTKAKYREKMGPFLPGVHHTPFPNCFRSCTHKPGEPCPIAAGEEIEKLFATELPPDTVAAIIVEPVQGEGGFVVPPPTFLPTLRKICDDNGILLILDEVQTGFGRTGRMFAAEHTATIPDIMCIAKAMGNGIPVAAMIAKPHVMNAWHTGEHGTTFGGNALACAAVVAVVETMTRERIPERAERLGKVVRARARGWQGWMPQLGDVRGLGMMNGLEFTDGGKPAPDLVKRVQRSAVDQNLLLLTSGVDDNVIRLMPPLTISEDDLDQGLGILEKVLREEVRA